MNSIIFVESPSKCKKIEQALPFGYKVIATCGHLKSINGLQNIEFKNNDISITYNILEHQKKRIKQFKQIVKEYNEVIIATDGDREGEGIAYHLCTILKLNPLKTRRVIFRDLSIETIQYAMNEPWQHLNMQLIYSYKSRNIIDLLIGHTITPIINNLIQSDKKISTGRCQTPALYIINQEYNKEIHNLTSNEVNVNIEFYGLEFKTKLNKSILSKDFFENLIKENFILKHENTRIKKIEPPNPLTTSKCIQLACQKFGFQPCKTMDILQKLYENGNITYHRTDSNVYSKEFINKINPLAITINDVKKDAHEGIRFTDIACDFNINSNEMKIYNLIVKISTEACLDVGEDEIMTFSAVFNNIKAIYEYTKVKKIGWRIHSTEQENNMNHFMLIMSIKENWIETPTQIKTYPIHHHSIGFNTGEIIGELTKLNIGRPSTYSNIIDKLFSKKLIEELNQDVIITGCVDEEYSIVKGEQCIIKQFENNFIKYKKGILKATELGLSVLETASKLNLFKTGELFNCDYSSLLESILDNTNEDNWIQACIDTKNKLNKLNKIENISEPQEDVVVVRKGKYGLYAIINGEKNISLSCFGNRQPESITKEELNKVILHNSTHCRELKNGLLLKYGKYGYYLTKNNINVNLKRFNKDPLTCDENELIEWFEL